MRLTAFLATRQMWASAELPATYKERGFPRAPRTDPDGPDSGIRLLPWVGGEESLLRPGVKDPRFRERLLMGSGVMVRMSCHQCRDEGAQEGFAAAPGVVHELEEAEV
jgi:hypothetical protein